MGIAGIIDGEQQQQPVAAEVAAEGASPRSSRASLQAAPDQDAAAAALCSAACPACISPPCTPLLVADLLWSSSGQDPALNTGRHVGEAPSPPVPHRHASAGAHVPQYCLVEATALKSCTNSIQTVAEAVPDRVRPGQVRRAASGVGGQARAARKFLCGVRIAAWKAVVELLPPTPPPSWARVGLVCCASSVALGQNLNTQKQQKQGPNDLPPTPGLLADSPAPARWLSLRYSVRLWKAVAAPGGLLATGATAHDRALRRLARAATHAQRPPARRRQRVDASAGSAAAFQLPRYGLRP